MDNNIKQFRHNILEEIQIRKKQSDLLKSIYKNIVEGDEVFDQFQLYEYKQFEEDWIVGLESFFPSLQKITRDIRSNLKYEEEILPIEKTRRTNPESIRHLLRNTRYIKEIDDNGGVIPEKVLNSLSEIDYGIYENRFIMTLINRLYDYLNQRLLKIRDNLYGIRQTNYLVSKQFSIANTKFDFEIKLNAEESLELEDIDIQNHRIYYRLENVFKIVTNLYNSDFMKIMSRYRKVEPPILKTQIILKNPDFRQAYLLWLYLDRLHELEYKVVNERKEKNISSNYRDEINQSLLVMFLTLFENTNFGRVISDDESFLVKEFSPKKDVKKYISNLNLDDIPVYDIEPQMASQYYLDQIKKSFQKQYQNIDRKKISYEKSLKQVLLEQYKIADQIFNYYFETDQDEDIFDYLLKEANPVKKYNEAYEKYLIIRIARDVKERIYNETLDLEAKWIRKIEELKNDALTHLSNSIAQHHDEIIESEEEEFKLKIKDFEQLARKRYIVNVEKRKKQLEQSINKVRKDYEDRLNRFKKSEENRVKNAKKQIRENFSNEKKLVNKSIREDNLKLTKIIGEERTKQTKEIREEYNKNKKEIRREINKKIKEISSN